MIINRKVVSLGTLALVSASTVGVVWGTGALQGSHRDAANTGVDRVTAETSASTVGAAPTEPGVGDTCPSSLPFPRVLPSSVNNWVTKSCGGNVARWTLGLTGAANTDTRGSLGPGALDAHAGSYVFYIVSFPTAGGPPGWKALPDPIVSDDTVKITNAILDDGSAARVTTPVNGYGLSRVEWIKDSSYFQLLSDHGATTTQGLTGISDRDLLSLANSVR